MNIEDLSSYGTDVLFKDSTLAKNIFYEIAKDACSYYLDSIHNNEGLYEYLAEMLQNILILEHKKYRFPTDISLSDHDDTKEIILNLHFGDDMMVVESIGYSVNVEYH